MPVKRQHIMFFLSLFRSEDDGNDSVKEVVAALSESRADVSKQATFGKPRLIEEGVYDITKRIEIPMESEYPVPPLRFDIDGDEIDKLLQKYDLSVSEIGEIEGVTVPVEEDTMGYYVKW